MLLTAAWLAAVTAGCDRHSHTPGALYASEEFVLTPDSIIEADGTVARATSPLSLQSDYQLPVTPASNEISFTFIFNGHMREFADTSRHHRLRLNPNTSGDTTLYTPFGISARENISYNNTPGGAMLPPATIHTFCLDMRPVLEAFGEDGYYTPRQGDTLWRDEFQGVWINGSDRALDPTQSTDLRITDSGDSIYRITVALNPDPFPRAPHREWKADTLPAAYPHATLGMSLPDALYNMGLSTIAADTSATSLSPMSILLAMAYVDPARSMEALRAQVSNGRITDPDPSCAWPVNTTRVAWVAAAHEVYNVTGDSLWAREAFEVARLSLADDYIVNYNADCDLYRGGAVPLRDAASYYAPWMDATDVHTSMGLVTNALYHRAFRAMADLADEIGEDPARYRRIASELADAVNINLWHPSRRTYSHCLYGTFPIASGITDNMGQALCMIFDIAHPEMRQRLMEASPSAPYGMPRLWPCAAAPTSRYNGTTDPLTLAFMAIACARDGYSAQLLQSMACLWRMAALLADNPWEVDAFTGAPLPYNVEPSMALTSAASRIAVVLRALGGMRFTTGGLEITPFIPTVFDRGLRIDNIRYRDTTLSVNITGTGNRVARFCIDGHPRKESIVPIGLTGNHTIEITMANNEVETAKASTPTTTVPLRVPPPPAAHITDGNICVDNPAPGADICALYRNGVELEPLEAPSTPIFDPQRAAIYAITATADAGMATGYTCPPLLYSPKGSLSTIHACDWATGGSPLTSDTTMVQMSSTLCTHFACEIEVPADGRYLIDLTYANGSGPLTDQRTCGIRSLLVNGDRAGVMVMPTTGLHRWDTTARSNTLAVTLAQGVNTIAIDYIVPYNINAAGSDNTILLKDIRLIKL